MAFALEEFVPRVYRFALRLTGDTHEAEDLTQGVMLRAWRHRRQLREPNATRVWLFRIAVNLWSDRLRQSGKRCEQSTSSAEVELLEDRLASPTQQAIRQEELQRAMSALDALPTRQRQLLYLHACEGLSIGEIAEVLDISYPAAKASLSAARKRMRCALADLFCELDASAEQCDT